MLDTYWTRVVTYSLEKQCGKSVVQNRVRFYPPKPKAMTVTDCPQKTIRCVCELLYRNATLLVPGARVMSFETRSNCFDK